MSEPCDLCPDCSEPESCDRFDWSCDAGVIDVGFIAKLVIGLFLVLIVVALVYSKIITPVVDAGGNALSALGNPVTGAQSLETAPTVLASTVLLAFFASTGVEPLTGIIGGGIVIVICALFVIRLWRMIGS